MAAVALGPGVIDKIALSSTQNLAQEIELDEKVSRVEIQFDNSGTSVAGAYSLTGTDGEAQVADAVIIYADTKADVVIRSGRSRTLGGTSIFVSSGTASADAIIRTY